MKRAARLGSIVLLVATLFACEPARLVGAPEPTGFVLQPPPGPPTPDAMERNVSLLVGSSSVVCDFIKTPEIKDFLADVGKSFGSRSVVVADVIAIGPSRWNTPSGALPTQAQANRMAANPEIVTPVVIRIVRNEKGVPVAGTVTAFVAAGKVGDATRNESCDIYYRDGLLTTWGGRSIKARARFLVFLSNKTALGRYEDPIARPRIDELFPILAGDVIGPSGDPEPVPFSV